MNTIQIFIVKDEDKVVYNSSTQAYNEKIEAIRARFLVELIEHYFYKEENIRLDVEVDGFDIFDSADMVVYKDDIPFVIIDCVRQKPKEIEMLRLSEKLIQKAKVFGAEYAVLIFKESKVVYSLKNTAKRITDFPKHEE